MSAITQGTSARPFNAVQFRSQTTISPWDIDEGRVMPAMRQGTSARPLNVGQLRSQTTICPWDTDPVADHYCEVAVIPPSAAPVSPVSLVTSEIAAIKRLLDSSTVSASFMGNRNLVGAHGSIEIDSVAERLNAVSLREISRRTGADRANGLYCVRKLREFYIESDVQINSSTVAKIYNFFAKVIAIITLPVVIPYRILQFLFCRNSIQYNIRVAIDNDGIPAIVGAPPSIEWNFS